MSRIRSLLVSAGLVAVTAVGGVACSNSSASNSDPNAPEGTATVTYTIDGTARGVRAGWTVGGKDELFFSFPETLPVGVDGKGVRVYLQSGQIPYVQAELRQGGTATCTVSVNGQVKQTSTATGKGELLTCSAGEPVD